ncbi:hypothetical protein ATANTOWER_002970 [Ataeniobius toweri]|uniref:Uncharacterized protein n=1 Tax=Ataeniobius toweri TaxID=208326 RepID=A0ABU7AE93_9TELE|nr:hypothetical protein [Ataeniobius toweri]
MFGSSYHDLYLKCYFSFNPDAMRQTPSRKSHYCVVKQNIFPKVLEILKVFRKYEKALCVLFVQQLFSPCNFLRRRRCHGLGMLCCNSIGPSIHYRIHNLKAP